MIVAVALRGAPTIAMAGQRVIDSGGVWTCTIDFPRPCGPSSAAYSVAVIMRRFHVAMLSAAPAAVVLACAPDPAAPSAESTTHRMERTVENGVATLVNRGGPRFAGEIFRYEKVAELESGDDPDSILHFAETFTMGDDGNFYVADTRRHRVAAFDSSGTYVRSIGQRGDGPGDLLEPFDVTIVDGALQVLGSRGFRLTTFALGGDFVDVAVHSQGDRPRAMYRMADGTRVLITAPFERGTEFQGYRARAVVVAQDGEIVAEIESDWVRDALMVTVEGLRYISPVQYSARPQAVFSPPPAADSPEAGGEILLTTGIEPVLNWHGLDGRLRRRVRIDLPPEPVTAAERRVIADDLDRRIAAAPELSDERERILGKIELRARRNNMVFEDPRPYWASAAVDDRGTVWLRHPHPVTQDFYANYVHRYRVVDRDGVYLGDTTWPPIQRAGRVVRGHLLAMVFDDETQQVVPTVFRVEPAVEGLDY